MISTTLLNTKVVVWCNALVIDTENWYNYWVVSKSHKDSFNFQYADHHFKQFYMRSRKLKSALNSKFIAQLTYTISFEKEFTLLNQTKLNN